MGAKAILAVMVVGTIGTILGVPTRSTPRRAEIVYPRRYMPAARGEAPWLSPEAAAELVGVHAAPGPLFAGIELGGSPPSAETRRRIAKFARENRVDIAIVVRNDEVAAIRIGVSFPGCCGYEGADVFALRLERPRIGCPWRRWENRWAWDRDGVQLQAIVALNRVDVRWVPGRTPDPDFPRDRTRVAF